MELEQLPTYAQASAAADDWCLRLGVIASYIDQHDYWSLCLVGKMFHAVFAPLLFQNPMVMADKLSSDRTPGYTRYKRLLLAIPEMRPSTLRMTTTLDFRATSADFDMFSRPRRDIMAELHAIFPKTPHLRCLVVDRRVDFKSRQLFELITSERIRQWANQASSLEQQQLNVTWSLETLALLSMRSHGTFGGIQVHVAPELFDNQLLSGLVYLDLSGSSGKHLLCKISVFGGHNFPNLSVLKLAQMGKTPQRIHAGVDWHSFSSITSLWSLDVSGNKLDDQSFSILANYSTSEALDERVKRRHDAYFHVEGGLVSESTRGMGWIVESDHSKTYCHPDRYYTDPPSYTGSPSDMGENRHSFVRRVGNEPIRGDALDDAIDVLSTGVDESRPVRVEWPSTQAIRGLTHLHINKTTVTLDCVVWLLWHIGGLIEHFECDQASLDANHGIRPWLSRSIPWLPKRASFYGVPGFAYMLRPVVMENLRVLKIHHSLVTNTPTVTSGVKSEELENIWIAERLSDRYDLAYPQTYIPDMNPRLYSLTLTRIPRYSTGVVIRRIVGFLKLLARQEQHIEQLKKLSSRRSPCLLRGLRRLSLEFDLDITAEMNRLSEDKDVDQAMEDFSAFNVGEDGTPSSSVSRTQYSSLTQSSRPVKSYDQQPPTTGEGRFDVFPFTATSTEYYRAPDSAADVWIGSGIVRSSNPPAVNAYMHKIAQHGSKEEMAFVQKATPCHVRAGVPELSYIYGYLWDLIVCPDEDITRPTKAELAGMTDVLGEIKAFREASRACYTQRVKEDKISGEVGQHEYYRGRVDIVRDPQKTHDDLGMYER